jgi:diaminohydroxyphosphoribosylaminopyrimidine deaminase/5-amino-6-(5-phosphoribosylamino)uracil reductase
MIKTNIYLQKAISKAWQYQFLTYPNPAVGACVVKNNEILSIEAHKEAGKPHAEVEALKYAFLKYNPNSKLKDLTISSDIHNFLIKNHNGFFKDCSIYVTLEPCNHIGKTPSCALLLQKLQPKKVIIGALDTNKIASGGIAQLKKANIEVEVLNDEDSLNLLLPFLKWQKSNFKFFKIALRDDGSYKDGYITTQDSLNLVHNIRTKLDIMVLGGETIRTDRPTLDSRFSINKKASDIFIYSRRRDFDKTIPLFDVKNRNITISNDLELLDKYNFIMFEGGLNLLEQLKNKMDMVMLFISHRQKLEKIFSYKKFGFKKIYSYFINKQDEIIFMVNNKNKI